MKEKNTTGTKPVGTITYTDNPEHSNTVIAVYNPLIKLV